MRPEPVSAVASEAWRLLLHPPAAHRGLWSPKGAPENSLAAFEAAVDAGYGIELDVRLSADGEVMVFHDDGLERMVGRLGKLAQHTAAELGAMRLKDTREPVPTLRQVLDRIDGRVLILVEIKSAPGQEGPLDQKVAETIKDYAGPLAVIGFNPFSHAWWAERHPDVLRGLNSHAYQGDAAAPFSAAQLKSLRNLEHVAIARPHFLGLGVDMLPSAAAARLRGQGYPIVAWTVRSADQWSAIEADSDNLIFEGFAP